MTTTINKNKDGEKLLKQYRKLAKKAQESYDKGTFSGHPDEQLDLIWAYEDMVIHIERAKERGWTVDESRVDSIKEGLEAWLNAERTNRNAERYDEILDNQKTALARAEAGLI